MTTHQIRKILLIVLIVLGQWSFSQSDTIRIKQHLNSIIETPQPRNYINLKSLNQVADYIHQSFSLYADSVYFQEYSVNGEIYKNVIAVFNNKLPETIIIGAHYDVCENQDGADDNASGVLGLLELARLFQESTPKNRIELVAYTLEEPPFFRTKFMGSAIHAHSVKERKLKVKGMICLEMIGYFDDTKGSQDYPLGILKWFYGSKGNYITLVNKFKKGKFARTFSNKYKNKAKIKAKKFTGPAYLPGVDFSDHLNYWALGYSAVMITDTAFYRNKEYHHQGDTADRLNIQKMAEVIDGVHQVLLAI